MIKTNKLKRFKCLAKSKSSIKQSGIFKWLNIVEV